MKMFIAINYFRFAKALHSRCLTRFWICQSSKYTRVLIHQGSKYNTRALNMLLVLNIPRFLICWGYRGFWICLWVMLEFVWKCQKMHEYNYICLIGFLKRQNLIFSKIAESIWFVFCFRLDIFANYNFDVVFEWFFVDVLVDMIVGYTKLNGHIEKAGTSLENF